MPAPVNRFKAALAAGQMQYGCWAGFGDPYATEVMSTAGFDWLVIDGEHAPNDIRSIMAQLQVLEGKPDSHPVVRLPMGEAWLIKQALDIGAQTLLIPMVETAEQARDLVRAMRYPPEGIRGSGAALARASRFAAIPDYIRTANDQMCLLVQVETVRGMEALDAILAVEGVDGVFIGPSDLAAEMGFDAVEVLEVQMHRKDAAYMQEIKFWEPGPDGQPQMIGGAFGGRTVEGARGIHGNSLNDWVRQYHQGVLGLDAAVGRLIAALEETDQLENTLVVFTSDQGFAWGQHGFCTKLAPYDANIRSPLIVSMPGTLPEGEVVEHPVAGVDLVPTFFSFADIKLPWEMHGHDLTPILNNPRAEWPHPAMTVFTARNYGSETDRIPEDKDQHYLNGVPWYVSLRQGRYKYIRTLVDNEIEELYDIGSDPEELTNLAVGGEHGDQLKSLREATVAEMRRTGWKLVDQLPRVKEAK